MPPQETDNIPPRRPLILILSCCGWGSGYKSAELGPTKLIQAGLASDLDAEVITIEATPPMTNGDLSSLQREQSIMDMAERVSNSVTEAVVEGNFPVVIGGDHTSAVGFHTGLARAHGQTGIVWIDTHPDLNTPQTSPSGNIHGMVLGGLLGRGSEAMLRVTEDCNILDQHVAMVGIRSIDDGEQKWIDEGNIHCMTMDHVREHGLQHCLAEATRTANSAEAGFGLSIDLDAIDPKQAPFVATPVDGGIDASELVTHLSTFPFSDRLLGMEVTEFTPRNGDDDDVTKACHLIKKLVLGVTQQ